MALGAQPGAVLGMFMREGSIMLLSGVLLGFLLAVGHRQDSERHSLPGRRARSGRFHHRASVVGRRRIFGHLGSCPPGYPGQPPHRPAHGIATVATGVAGLRRRRRASMRRRNRQASVVAFQSANARGSLDSPRLRRVAPRLALRGKGEASRRAHAMTASHSSIHVIAHSPIQRFNVNYWDLELPWLLVLGAWDFPPSTPVSGSPPLPA